jgi:hypothetical protein
MLVEKMQNCNLVVLVFVVPDVAEMAVVLVDFGMAAEMVELDFFDCFVVDNYNLAHLAH